jgi:hypothetical protein
MFANVGGGLMTKLYNLILRFGFLPVGIAYFCIHGALFLYDVRNPSAFLSGDRSTGRIVRIADFISAPSDYWTLLVHPFPGDFAVHAILYRLGGQYFVIGAQIFLQFAILLGVYLCISRLLGRAAAVFGGLLLIVMPGALMNPHMLVTETWFSAFLSLGVLFFCLAINDRRELKSTSYLLAAFVSLALATFIRPQGLLLPISMALALTTIIKRGRTPILIGVAASYLIFPLSLMIIRFLTAGDFSLGESEADLGTNLLLRANRVLYNSFLEPGQKLTILQFLKIAVAHPLATLNTFYADAANLFLNPGSNHLVGSYLKLYDPKDFRFWVSMLDRAGPVGVIGQILREDLPFLTTFAVWMIIHMIVLVGVSAACFQALRWKRNTPPWVWLVLVATFTYLVTAFAAGQLRWSHRTGVEPLLVILAAWGFFSSASGARSENKDLISSGQSLPAL